MKKTIKTTKKVKEDKVDTIERSAAYLAYKAFLDQYALERPEKFENRKEALLAKLNQL